MWKVVVMGLALGVAGCNETTGCPAPELHCRDLRKACGNNRIDTCHSEPVTEDCFFVGGKTEVCDGTATQSCQSSGYYDGTPLCVDCFDVDTSGCRACADSVLACGMYERQLSIDRLVVNGTTAVATGRYTTSLFEGTTFVKELASRSVGDVAAVPGGFLLSGGADVVPMALDGTPGTIRNIAPSAGGTHVAYGPGGRVLLAWFENSNVVTAVADTTGALLSAPAIRFPLVFKHGLAITTDGTQFFVAHAGKVMRIAADNTLLGITNDVLVEEPFNGEDLLQPRVLWDGVTGWYIAHDWIQEFDANGAPVGAKFRRRVIDATAANGQLLVLSDEAPELVIVAYVSRSALFRTTKVGSFGPGAIAMFGTDVLAVWSRNETRTAIVSAP